MASSTAPRGLHVLAVRLTELVRWFDLQSADFFCLSDLQSAYQTAFADFLCFIIRNRRCSYIVCIGFTNAEYRIVIVDFIVALRRTKGRGRRTLRSPPSPSSGLHLIHPGKSAAAGHFGCRGFGTI